MMLAPKLQPYQIRLVADHLSMQLGELSRLQNSRLLHVFIEGIIHYSFAFL